MKKGTRCTRWDQLGDTLPGLAHTSRYTLILNRTELGSDTENETSFGFGSSRHCQDKGGLFLFFGVFLEGGCQKWIRLLGGGVVTVTRSTVITKGQEWCCPLIV